MGHDAVVVFFFSQRVCFVDVLQTATFASKCVCEGGCPDVPGGNGSEGSGGLSTGSILLIVYV